ncbi:MAG TPA: nickel pincer cofactor biosynthesis protein LarC [Methylomusa anaerophila]|uniref:Pyridinium-3,5-bisthiocarboxylic acid mononucleotide nickel insertion protein n=1 Tax=Methylomusa anaerophila TaxID=1930071 RepID=A0A348AQF7_9FIRM|nr:nickel pincer cofactor biosynthesis protein LarC [Methylomusa anaerophila]BBB93305.1 hypothetical protein MAMMFC1_04017 [Methylomusa anaerophila]HML86864.1 nickel pincer cofactor biosynthesis protein LarC [Methylomusa anaerophila]
MNANGTAIKTKAAFCDCFAGISGNMMLGALIDIGLPEEKLKKELAKLPVHGYEIKTARVDKCGISAVHVDVIVGQDQQHRHLSDILDIIENSTLSDAVKEKSTSVFRRLAEAEAKVHGVALQEVHFHEVGAVDAIIDVVGTIWGLEYMGIEALYTSKLHVGSGFTECCHGTIPVPAPATVELLIGIPYYQGDIKKELVTPTGAAIVASLGQGFGSMPEAFVSKKVGYGAGTWNLPIPNILRLYIGEIVGIDPNLEQYNKDEQAASGSVTVIEANIDDLNPQVYPFVLDKLLAAGALDAWITPIIMKKGRPAVKLSALVEGTNKTKAAEIILTETSSIGVRFYEAGRLVADREFLPVITPWGQVRVKISSYQGKIINVAPEYEDCRKLATERGVPLKVVQHIALKEAMPFVR